MKELDRGITGSRIVVPKRNWWQPSLAGLYFGGLWLALTFTPSLVPRPWAYQGVLGGVAFALGYGLGTTLVWLWNFLDLPMVPQRWQRSLYWMLVLATALRIGWYLQNASGWQNITRQLMDMPDVDGTMYVRILLLSAIIATFLIGLVQALIFGIRFAAGISRNYVQRRVASVFGGVAFIVLLIQLVNGTLVSAAITLIDQTQAATDVADPPGASQPEESTRSGSSASLVAWNRLGKAGKQFVDEGPRRSDIEAFAGKPAREPIRIYVGLRSADGAAAQAAMALQELKRTNAFERKLLVIATPTGTGWVDNAGIAPLEYMHDGDTAVVGVQYSYLQSPLSLILEPGRSQASAAIVFETIYEYWKTLPKVTRPKLYLFGLSLGSHGSETSAPLYAYVSDAFNGAIWAGPPFRNSLWRNIQRNRNQGSTAWLPHFEDGSMIRVIGPFGGPDANGQNWGPIRIVYVVNPSDAIVFFEENMWFREPDWMKPPRGPDLSPQLKWVPIITFFQIGLDMLSAALVPPGHGHNYAAAQYIVAWVEVSAPEGWTNSETLRLQAVFEQQQDRLAADRVPLKRNGVRPDNLSSKSP